MDRAQVNFEERVFESLQKVYQWSKERNYKGWDPYDALHSRFDEKVDNDFIKFLVMQLNLYSPFNFRKTLGVEKGISNKAIGLFLKSNLNLYELEGEEVYKEEAENLLNYLIDNSLEYNGHKCWASFYFKYKSKNHYLSDDTPDIVGTSIICKALLDYYSIFKEDKALNYAKSGLNFILDELLVKSNNGFYLKYTPIEERKIVFNVSGLALDPISKFLDMEEDDEILEIGQETTKFLIENQSDEGYWPYSVTLPDYEAYNQIDFHQGFILDGLFSFLPHIKDEELYGETIDVIEKGARFYREKQFTEEGKCYYRYPIKYPIDVHNQAQGIITFSKLGSHEEINDDYSNFAKKITKWTIENMQSKEGYFYAHKWPMIVNKIPYMRWGQTWMLLALITNLKSIR